VYASETLLFYNAVEEFKNKDLPRAQFFEKAVELFNTYINPHTSGDKEVNLPAWIKDELMVVFLPTKKDSNNAFSQLQQPTLILENSYDNSKITKNIFDKAQKHILELLRYDSWPRFLQSDYYLTR
jgi:hypothetical protein